MKYVIWKSGGYARAIAPALSGYKNFLKVLSIFLAISVSSALSATNLKLNSKVLNDVPSNATLVYGLAATPDFKAPTAPPFAS